MEAMEAQIRSDKTFIKTQLAEREQERDEYELKIDDLKQLLTRKSTQFLDIEDTYTKKVTINLIIQSIYQNKNIHFISLPYIYIYIYIHISIFI